MTVELVITEDIGTVKKFTLIESHDWSQIMEDIKAMKGINPHKEVIRFLQDELLLALRNHSFG